MRAVASLSDAAAQLAALREAGLLRELRVLDRGAGPRVVLDGREVLLLCSNDYLGLAAHPAVIRAAGEAAERWGAGAGSSRLVSGTLALHGELEAELAAFKGTEACLAFGSGFLANTGVVSALAGEGGVVHSDALNHASIIDGCRLAGADVAVYPHADLDALAASLEAHRGHPATIVTDSVFSMDGDVAPLEGIVDLARRHGARVVVDEAHGTGVLGPGGRGAVAALGLEGEIDVVVGTLSKALGAYGAFACCDRETAALLVNRARTFIYSTALPPPMVGAALAALGVVRDEPRRVARLAANAALLREALRAEGLAVPDGPAPIVPLILGAPEDAVVAAERALEGGVFAQAIRPPTVPAGTSRLRLTAMATHTPDDLRGAARVLGEACRR